MYEGVLIGCWMRIVSPPGYRAQANISDCRPLRLGSGDVAVVLQAEVEVDDPGEGRDSPGRC